MLDTQTTRVSLLITHGALQDSVEAVLEQAANMTIVATGEPAEVLVLDGTMPGPTPLDSIRSARHGNGDSRVVLLSVHDDPDHVWRALDAGADGYVLADWAGRDLISAVHSVKRGQAYVSPRLRWTAAGGLGTRDGKDHQTPTALEMPRCGE